jgi:hypothetical protein
MEEQRESFRVTKLIKALLQNRASTDNKTKSDLIREILMGKAPPLVESSSQTA